MNYKTALQGVEFFSFHGLYPEERLTGGKFIVDVSVEQEVKDSITFGRLAEVVNYEQLYALVKTEMDKPRDLIEMVAKKILDHIGSRFGQVHTAEVKITKVKPGGMFISGSSCVTLTKKYV